MRGFVLHASSFVALQGTVLALVWFACPRQEDHYVAASIDKRHRLHTAERPRIIFVGGSSVAFGFDSRELTGSGFAPVNMGHLRGLGLRFMLAQVRDALEAGDIVVVSPEHELLWQPKLDASLITYLEYDPLSARHLDFQTGRRLCDGGLTWIGRKLRCALFQVGTEAQLSYTRRSFDAVGDFVEHRGRPPRSHEPLRQRWPEPEAVDVSTAVSLLDDFADHCEAVGARCVFAFAPFRRPTSEAGWATPRRVEAIFADSLDMPIAIGIDDAAHDPHDYFDPGPHLTEDAARLRTRKLVAALGLEGR